MRAARLLPALLLGLLALGCEPEPACDSFCEKLATCGPEGGAGCPEALSAELVSWQDLLACRFAECVLQCETYDVVLRPELMATLDGCVRRTPCAAFSLDACFLQAAQVVDAGALEALVAAVCDRQLACGQVASVPACRQAWLDDPAVGGLVVYSQGVLACGGGCIQRLACERLDERRMWECLVRCGVLAGE